MGAWEAQTSGVVTPAQAQAASLAATAYDPDRPPVPPGADTQRQPDRAHHRSLRDPGAAGPGRDGHGLPGPRPQPGAAGGHQGPAARAGQQPRPGRAADAGGARPGPAAAPQRGERVLHRALRGGALLRHGVRARRDAGRSAAATGEDALGRGAGVHHPDHPRAAGSQPARHRPPRREAVQPAGLPRSATPNGVAATSRWRTSGWRRPRAAARPTSSARRITPRRSSWRASRPTTAATSIRWG